MDKILGGPGLGGRRDPHRLALGDRVDWWRVVELERPRRLVLAAEMKVDGDAWLILEVEPDGTGSTYTQRALYRPTGLPGRLYWWSMLPFHAVIFPLMSRNILAAAKRESAPADSDSEASGSGTDAPDARG